MWPQKDGLGVQLTYGITSPSILLHSQNPNQPWLFSRQREGGLPFYELTHSRRVLVPAALAPAVREGKNNKVIESNISDLAKSQAPLAFLFSAKEKRHQSVLQSKYIYDPAPVWRPLDAAGVTRFDSHVKEDIFAFASGDVGSLLTVRITRKIDEFVHWEGETDGVKILKCPTPAEGATLQLDTRITQVEISRSMATFDIRKDLLLVRTLSSLYVIHVKLTHSAIGESSVTLNVIAHIEPRDYFKSSLAYAAANPFDNSQFACVDAKGYWMVFTINGQRDAVNVVFRGGTNQELDISNFKRIRWGSNTNEIVILGRTFLKTISLPTGVTNDIIAANKWSRLRDYIPCDSKDDYGFLLTSREVIWIDVSNGFKRILAWKHWLDEEDPTLQLQLRTINDVHYLTISSQHTAPMLLLQWRLGGNDGLPMSIHDPILLLDQNGDGESPMHSHILLPLEPNHIQLFRITANLELSRSILSTSKGMVINTTSTATTPNPSTAHSNSTQKRMRYDRLNNEKLKHVHKHLFHVSKFKPSTFPDPTVFQTYITSLHLDRSQPTQHPQPVSSYSGDDLGAFSSFSEFDNMMVQLGEFFNENGLEFNGLLSVLDIIFHETMDVSGIKTLEDLYDSLVKMWRSPVIARSVTRDLALNSSMVYDVEREKEILDEKIEEMPLQMRQIMKDWDRDFSIDEAQDHFSQLVSQKLQRVVVEQSQPTIQLTQSQAPSGSQSLTRPKTKKSSSRGLSSSQQQFHSSQGVLSQSQTLSGSQKRKKRKVRGFA